METLTQCPACSGKTFTKFLSCVDYTVSRDEFQIMECGSCHLMFTNPRPDANSIGRYYESDAYISHSNTSKGIINKIYKSVRRLAIDQKLKLINNERGSMPKKILDIGSGTGEFLQACKSTGWETTGVEPNEKARNLAKQNYSLRIWDESALSNSKEQFSIITMWHVLEHVHDLKNRINQLHSSLEKGGRIVIAVPNYTSWDAHHYGKYWAAYDLPRHLYHFSPEVLKKLFLDSGFTHTRSLPMKFDSYYVSMLSEKYKRGYNNLLSAFVIGLKSNMNAGSTHEKYSSVIYLFAKN